MSQRESGILTVSHRCTSLHLLFSSVTINFPGSLRAYNSERCRVCGNCNVFVAKKLYPQEKVLLPIQNRGFGFRFRAWRTATGGRLRIRAIALAALPATTNLW